MIDPAKSKHFWWLYDMSLLETLEIIFSDTIYIDDQGDKIAIVSVDSDHVSIWHGVSRHE